MGQEISSDEGVKENCARGLPTTIEAVVEKKTKARGLGCPHRKTKPSKTPAVAYDIEEWMQGLKGASGGVPKRNNDKDCGADQWSIHTQKGGQSRLRCRWQGGPRVPRDPLGGSPSPGGSGFIRQSE